MCELLILLNDLRLSELGHNLLPSAFFRNKNLVFKWKLDKQQQLLSFLLKDLIYSISSIDVKQIFI